MKTTITCPMCQQEHALFYRRYGDRSWENTLWYICNRVEKQHAVKGGDVEIRYSTMAMQAPQFIPDLPIPEEWEAKYAKQKQGEQQFQLLIMR